MPNICEVCEGSGEYPIHARGKHVYDIVQIVEPHEVAGIYGVEIERCVRTHAYSLSHDECERLLADTLVK